jgi:SAM-dependent methyltransferase
VRELQLRPLWVKTGNAHSENIASVLHPKTAICRRGWHVHLGPWADIWAGPSRVGIAINARSIGIAEREAMVSDFTAFGDMERGSWSDAARASGYVELFASASDQAIESLMEAVGAKSGLRSLDLCCGQGNVSAALIGRGCEVVGVDFSPAMLAYARKRVPSATFIEADAQGLPFDDAAFDIVVSNLGVCHVPDQPRALAEARRVLGPGGRFAMTVWCGPDVSPCFKAVYGAIKVHGGPGVSAPPGPDFHQFARRGAAERLLSEAGFAGVDLTIVDCAWDLDSPARLFEIFEKGTVRAAMLLARQPPQNLTAIRSALTQAVQERFAYGDRWRVPMPAALLRATA